MAALMPACRPPRAPTPAAKFFWFLFIFGITLSMFTAYGMMVRGGVAACGEMRSRASGGMFREPTCPPSRVPTRLPACVCSAST